MEQLALEAVGLSKRYGRRDALCDVDLIVRSGRIHGVLGPNGAGKTTLMRLLLGLVRRDAGTVRLLGHSLESTAGPIPDGVAGFVETPAFYPYLSGRQNLALMARLDGCDGAPLKESVARVLEQVGIAAHADAAVSGCSAGMRQRLGLAAALLRSPRLLVLDEPTSALDPAGARDVRALARRLADEGAAVVLSSHDMTEVEELCDELTIIDGGRVIFAGTVHELRRRAPDAVHRLCTSDDRTALDLASQWPGVKAGRSASGDGLDVSADVAALDACVIALGRSGIAVRSLERKERSLETLFLQLTGNDDHGAEAAQQSCDAQDGSRASTVSW
jgi:ABC-2 type transport system ATP-binding protein